MTVASELTGKASEDDEQRQFGWALHDVFRLFQRAWNRRLKESGTGISPAQSRVLTELHRQSGVTQTALAEEVQMEKAPLGRLLDRMEELCFIIRQPDPADRRVRRVYPTGNVEALAEPMWCAAQGMFEIALEGLTTDERATLMHLLERLKQNLLAEEERNAAIGK